MDGTYFTVIDTESNKAYVLTISGRMDTIIIVALEREVIGQKITGRLFRVSNSFETDELYYYALHHLRTAHICRDPKTKNWVQSTQEDFQGLPRPNHPITDICWKSILIRRKP